MAAANPELEPRGRHGELGFARIWSFRPRARRIQAPCRGRRGRWRSGDGSYRTTGLGGIGNRIEICSAALCPLLGKGESEEQRGRGRGGAGCEGEWKGRACLLFRAGNGLFITGVYGLGQLCRHRDVRLARPVLISKSPQIRGFLKARILALLRNLQFNTTPMISPT
jgi:hypothetical protein